MSSDLGAIIVSLLEDGNYDIRMRPIPMKWAKKCFLALIIPAVESELVIEFYHSKGSAFWVNHCEKWDIGSRVGKKRYEFDLASPKSYEDLKKYLEVSCLDRRTIVEFDAALDFDYHVAETKSDWMHINETSKVH